MQRAVAYQHQPNKVQWRKSWLIFHGVLFWFGVNIKLAWNKQRQWCCSTRQTSNIEIYKSEKYLRSTQTFNNSQGVGKLTKTHLALETRRGLIQSTSSCTNRHLTVKCWWSSWWGNRYVCTCDITICNRFKSSKPLTLSLWQNIYDTQRVECEFKFRSSDISKHLEPAIGR